MRKATIFVVVAWLLTLGAVPVYADGIPPLPHAFYGDVDINDASAPEETTVEARCEGVRTGIAGNPITTTKVGKYGSSNPLEAKLIVQGDILEGATITFYVNGHLATTDPATVKWHSGETTKVDLSVTITVPAPPPPEEDVGAPPPAYVETDIFGIGEVFRISDEGEILKTIEATSEDGMLTLTIPEGTTALDKDGDPLDSLEAAVDESPPEPPEDAHIIGLAYDFGPDGATFDPPITFTWSYDPADIPEDVAEEDLVIAYYDEEADEWVELDCVVDIENNTITASVEHFSIFAVIARVPAPPPPLVPAAFSLSNLTVEPTEVEPGEAVVVLVSVANTGGTEGSYSVVLKINGVKEADKSVTVAAGESQDVSFSVTREDPGSYSVAVNGLSGSFTVVAPPPPPPVPAAFSVTNLSVQPVEVEPKEAVTITVSVANTGGTEGSYSVVLKINGVKEAEKSVTVAAGGSEIISFSVTGEKVGSYNVVVDGLSGSFTVVAPPPPPPLPAAFSLSALSIQPASVESGEAVSITVSVANTGGTEGSYSVVLKINGVKEADKSVTVAAGESQDVSFSVTKEDAGTYSIVVDGLSGSFTVVAPPPPPPVKPLINWPVLAAIIVGVIVVGLLIFYVVRRRA